MDCGKPVLLYFYVQKIMKKLFLLLLLLISSEGWAQQIIFIPSSSSCDCKCPSEQEQREARIAQEKTEESYRQARRNYYRSLRTPKEKVK
jgi:hypothetical protein